MKIKVTESHIERGRRCMCHSCPLALAFLEATGEKWGIVADGAVRVRDGWKFHFPAWVTNWVVNYDDYYPMTPIEFVVPALEGVGA